MFFMHFYPGIMTIHAESINSDLKRRLAGQTFTTHTTLDTEQEQYWLTINSYSNPI